MHYELCILSDQTPLNYAVALWNLIPSNLAELNFPEFKRRMQEHANFEILQVIRERRNLTLPVLKYSYANL